jgi:hypothetical protein
VGRARVLRRVFFSSRASFCRTKRIRRIRRDQAFEGKEPSRTRSETRFFPNARRENRRVRTAEREGGSREKNKRLMKLGIDALDTVLWSGNSRNVHARTKITTDHESAKSICELRPFELRAEVRAILVDQEALRNVRLAPGGHSERRRIETTSALTSSAVSFSSPEGRDGTPPERARGVDVP